MRDFRIALFGPPGSGKGTQARFLSDQLHIPAISSGVLFRDHQEKKTHDIGIQTHDFIIQGKLVPDSIVNDMIQNRLREKDAERGFILDGYPRTIEQVHFLQKLCPLTHAISIALPDTLAYERIALRLVCSCGEVYHRLYRIPFHDERCDKCRKKIYHRGDDKEAVVRVRIKTYHEETGPIFAYYKSFGILFEIDGARSIEDVYQDIRKHLL